MEFFFLAEHETFVVYWVNIAEKQYKQWNFAFLTSSLIEIIKDNK